MIISLIAAVDQNMGIGKGNKLLCHLPRDLKRFKQITMGKPIVMGRKTFQSIGKPLPGRRNIVISKVYKKLNHVDVFSNLERAFVSCKNEPDVMVIGGATLYQQLIQRADTLYLTHIHSTFEADTYFPNFDKQQWLVVDSQFVSRDEKNPFDFELKTYQKVSG